MRRGRHSDANEKLCALRVLESWFVTRWRGGVFFMTLVSLENAGVLGQIGNRRNQVSFKGSNGRCIIFLDEANCSAVVLFC